MRIETMETMILVFLIYKKESEVLQVLEMLYIPILWVTMLRDHVCHIHTIFIFLESLKVKEKNLINLEASTLWLLGLSHAEHHIG